MCRTKITGSERSNMAYIYDQREKEAIAEVVVGSAVANLLFKRQEVTPEKVLELLRLAIAEVEKNGITENHIVYAGR